MFYKQSLENTKVRGQTVLVRVDYNVPMKDGKITDDLRIRETLPTIELLEKKGARRIVLMSHLGRPEGKKVAELSLAPVAEKLKELLPEKKVFFVSDVAGPDVEEAVENLPVGGILLLENLRFFPGEEENSAEFAREIAESTHAEIFVQDGFAVVHRAHASTSAITSELPSVAGPLLEREVSVLSKLAESPAHPFVVMIGGAKVADKQPIIKKFLKSADKIIVGGKIAADIADGKVSEEEKQIFESEKIYIASDFVSDSEGAKLDLGPESTAEIIKLLEGAKTVLWNGALGYVEKPEYAKSSTEVAEYLGKHPEIYSVICGGDTTGFVENLQKENRALKYGLISTGGGAALELLSGEALPGVESLDDKE